MITTSQARTTPLPRVPGLIGMRTPEARDAQGRPLRGRIYTQVQSTGPVADFLLSDRGHVPYPAADLEEPGAHDRLSGLPGDGRGETELTLGEAAGGAGLVFMESTKIDPAGCSTPRWAPSRDRSWRG